MFEKLEAFDQELFLTLNGLHVDFLDPVFAFITHKFSWIPLYIFLAYLLYRKYGVKGLLLSLAVIALMVLTTDQLTNFSKSYFGRYRPCKNLEIGSLVHLATGYCGGWYSFFSGHSSNSFAVATCLGILLQNRKWQWGLWIWAATVAYSRVYVGVHYPADIVVGSLVGLGLGFLFAKLYLVLQSRLIHKPA
ncbi:MAG: phosphatase PAP2 family protein [Salibacteraceae bacterium]